MKTHLPRFNERSYAHFVTTKTFQNRKVFTREHCCRILLENIEFYRNNLGFEIIGYVIMPDHVHLIVWWDVDEHKDLTISKVMQGIKSHSARQIVDYLYHRGRRGPLTSSKPRLGQGTQDTHYKKHAVRSEYPRRRMSEQKFKIWQPSFYDFNIYTEEKLYQKLNYLHYNPVRAGLADEPSDYPYSSY